MTQPQIPEELGNAIAELAAGLNLGVDEAVRKALQDWVDRVRQLRMPDVPFVDDTLSIETPFPYSDPHPIVTQKAENARLPDVVELG